MAEKENNTENQVTVVQEPKKAKPAKQKKTVPTSKLPAIYRKKYTRGAFERKILKKIYIDADKELVEQLYDVHENEIELEILSIPQNKQIAKSDFERLKIIAAEIKKQKSTIKFLPLIAVLVFLAALIIVVALFKNFVVDKALTSAMQGIFSAKTDIEKVDVQILGASLEIDGLQQANRDSPMKNLFQIDKIHIDFNLTDLLRGKFHAENIEVSGVALDTDRTESGKLPHDTDDYDERNLVEKLQDTSVSLADAAAEKLKEMFADYNPETMLENLQNELSSPAVANKISEDVKTKVEKWQNVPKEYQASIESLTKNVNTIAKTNWGKIYDKDVLAKTLITIDDALTESNALQKKVDSTAKDIKSDSSAVANYAKELQTAMTNDTKIVQSKITDMKNTFSPSGLKSIMTSAVESMLYEKAGKFAPYVNKALNAAQNAKGAAEEKEANKTEEQKEKEAARAERIAENKEREKTQKAEKKAKEKARILARSQGRTIYYKADKVPKILIENLKASGYEYQTNNLLFEGTATEISSDQNMRGTPATINANFNVLGKANSANIVVDARKDSSAKLITANYSGKGYPISADAQVFKLSSASDISANLVADKDGTLKIGGNLDMAVTNMTGMTFEPARVCNLYSNALSEINKLTIGFTAGYDADKGVVLSIDNVDKLAMQLVEPVTKAIQGELNTIALDAQNKVTAVLSEKTGIAQDTLKQFTNIESLVNGQVTSVKDLKKQLESQKAQINKQMQSAGKKALIDIINKI